MPAFEHTLCLNAGKKCRRVVVALELERDAIVPDLPLDMGGRISRRPAMHSGVVSRHYFPVLVEQRLADVRNSVLHRRAEAGSQVIKAPLPNRRPVACCAPHNDRLAYMKQRQQAIILSNLASDLAVRTSE